MQWRHVAGGTDLLLLHRLFFLHLRVLQTASNSNTLHVFEFTYTNTQTISAHITILYQNTKETFFPPILRTLSRFLNPNATPFYPESSNKNFKKRVITSDSTN